MVLNGDALFEICRHFFPVDSKYVCAFCWFVGYGNIEEQVIFKSVEKNKNKRTAQVAEKKIKGSRLIGTQLIAVALASGQTPVRVSSSTRSDYQYIIRELTSTRHTQFRQWVRCMGQNFYWFYLKLDVYLHKLPEDE